MEIYLSISQMLSQTMDQLTQGYGMFGDHVVWLWAMLPIWGIATCLILIKMENDEDEQNRIYVARAEQNMPRLQELTKQRSTEILEIRPIKRDK